MFSISELAHEAGFGSSRNRLLAPVASLCQLRQLWVSPKKRYAGLVNPRYE